MMHWLVPMALILLMQPAAAGELPVASRTIYPRDIIAPDMLEMRQASPQTIASGLYVEGQSEAIGKVARQTLLKGAYIPAQALEVAKLVVNGGQVRILFKAGDIVIVAYGSAMQDGALGELIRARNSDSGLIISGVVQQDGSVRVGEAG